MSNITESIAQQIRDARTKVGLTQKEVGERLGVTESTYSRYESGQQNLTLSTLDKICKAIGVKMTVNIDL